MVQTSPARGAEVLTLLRRGSGAEPTTFVLRPQGHLPGPQTSTADGLRRERHTSEQLQRDAARLAATQTLAPGRPRRHPLLTGLRTSERTINTITAGLSDAVRLEQSISLAAEWLLDNAYIVRRHVGDVRRNLSRRFYDVLPILGGAERAGQPRIYDLSYELVSHTDAEVHRAGRHRVPGRLPAGRAPHHRRAVGDALDAPTGPDREPEPPGCGRGPAPARARAGRSVGQPPPRRRPARGRPAAVHPGRAGPRAAQSLALLRRPPGQPAARRVHRPRPHPGLAGTQAGGPGAGGDPARAAAPRRRPGHHRQRHRQPAPPLQRGLAGHLREHQQGPPAPLPGPGRGLPGDGLRHPRPLPPRGGGDRPPGQTPRSRSRPAGA